MPVGLRWRSSPSLDAGVTAFLERHRRCISTRQDCDAAGFHVSRRRRGYLSSMYGIACGQEEYLLAVKHHDHAAARTRRAGEVMRARLGRNVPRPVLVDLTAREIDDPVIVTEMVRSSGRQRALPSPRDLALLLADFHTDQRLTSLPVDRKNPKEYSLWREFNEESGVIETFVPGPLHGQLRSMRAWLLPFVERWSTFFDPGDLVYCHGDLPHHHVYETARGLVAVHWEFSRRSHPAREFGRTAALGDYSEPEFLRLLNAYRRVVPFRIEMRCIRAQELLEHFYGCIHTAFWMDRSPSDVAIGHEEATLARFKLTFAYLQACAPRVHALRGNRIKRNGCERQTV